MSRVIVSGASGFVGSNLTRKLLELGNEVYIFARKESKLWRLADIISQLELFTLDMEDKNSIKKALQKIRPDIVYHLGAYGGYPFQEDINTIIRSNILYSVNLMDASRMCGLERFVNVGSSSEYGPKKQPMKESDFPQPVTPYGISKLTQTQFAQYFYEQHELPIVTLRLFSVYGPYEEPGRLIFDLMTAAVRNKPINLYSPSPRRDYVFMSDVIDAFLKAAKKPDIEGKIFNIGSGKDHSVGNVVDIVNEITKKKLEVSWGSVEKKRTFDTKNKWIANINEAKKHLRWKPHFSFKKGLLETFQWYSDNIDVYKKN